MSAFFVAGTGTDVGKTFVTASLIRHLRAHARSLEVLRPIASGFDANNWATSDAGVLLSALEKELYAEYLRASSSTRGSRDGSNAMVNGNSGGGRGGKDSGAIDLIKVHFALEQNTRVRCIRY